MHPPVHNYIFKGFNPSSAKWSYNENFIKANIKNSYKAKFVFPYFSIQGNTTIRDENTELCVQSSVNIQNYKLGVGYRTENFSNGIEKKNFSGYFSYSNVIPISDLISISSVKLSSDLGLSLALLTNLYDGKATLSFSKKPYVDGQFSLSGNSYKFKITNSSIDVSSILNITEEYKLLINPSLQFVKRDQSRYFSSITNISFIHPMYSLSFIYDTKAHAFITSIIGKYENFIVTYTTRIANKVALNVFKASYETENSKFGIKYIPNKRPVFIFQTKKEDLPNIKLSINFDDVIKYLH